MVITLFLILKTGTQNWTPYKFRFSLNANGGCIWYDYDAGTWKSYSGITKYELNANILIIKDSYSSGDETDWQTCKRFKIVSIKGNTMICTVCLMDEGDTERLHLRKDKY